MISKLKDLKNHQGFMKYFKNTSWLFTEKIFRMVVGLFVGIWVARYLGPEKFGLFSYAQSFVGLFSAIATLGLNGIVVRELVKFPEKEKELLGTAFLLKVFGAAITLCILAIAVNFTSNDNYTNMLIFIISSAVIFQSFNIIDFYFQAKVMSKYVVFTNSFSLLLSSIVKIVLILNHAPIMAFAWVVVFDSLVLSIGYLYWYFKIKKEFLLSQIMFDFELAKSLLKDSWPLIISGMAIMIYARIDQVMIKEMVDNNEVGQYSVAIRLIEQFDFLSVLIVKSIAPSLTNAKKISQELYFNRLLNLYRLMFFIFLVTFSFVFLFGKDIVLLLYGNAYSMAAGLFVLASFRTLYTNFGIASSQFITNENLFKYSMIFTIMGASINILLNYFLIPLYGAEGALVATIISFTFSIFISYFLFQQTRKNAFLMLSAILTFYKFSLKEVK